MNATLRMLRFVASMGPSYLVYRLGALVSRPRLRMMRQLTRFTGVGLEIGGPSPIFGVDGIMPVYEAADKIDNVLFADRTRWEGGVVRGQTFTFSSRRPPGQQYVLDGAELACLPQGSYDFILSSHMLEHSANPIGALHHWKRLLKADGILLLVLPHRDGTFDHRRPVTPLQHLLDDFNAGTREDDDTHLAEILRLHDLRRDPEQASSTEFRAWILQNAVNRGAHHHVFDTRAAVAMVRAAGLNVIEVEPAMPFHIVLLAVNAAGATVAQSELLLEPGSEVYRRSPFASDRNRPRS